MNLKRLFKDDDAVSPVIGVILMVAITVILAAVIGAFVLDLGGSQDTSPSVTWEYDWDSTAGSLTITHNGGDAVKAANLQVKVGTSSPVDATTVFSATELTAGDSGTVSASSSDDVKMIWKSPDSSDTSIIGTYTVP